MRRPKLEAQRWLAQARSDLAFAELGLREGFHAQACFMCQQAAEKALKALHYLTGARVVVGHSIVELLAGVAPRHPQLRALGEAAQQLDQFYVPTRYPNGLPGGVPAQVFSRAQAERALEDARQFVESAETIVG
ncbi:MAG: HEPN domain-containing protein [Candidatus Rokubacteria bacterium]|nr:HEPN domain-containing protein [Candidatus Rokubacteria bacterium]